MNKRGVDSARLMNLLSLKGEVPEWMDGWMEEALTRRLVKQKGVLRMNE